VLTAVIVVSTRRTKSITHHLGIFMRLTALLTIAVTILMFAHIAEIGVWAGMLNLMDVKIIKVDAFEFAFENYVGLGYGDALPMDERYRVIGPLMSLNGLLLIGWSIAVIFEVMRMAEFEIGRRSKHN
jgi:Ion channel